MKRPNLWGILDGTVVEKKGQHDFTPWAIVDKISLEKLSEWRFHYEFQEINGFCYFDCYWDKPGFALSETSKAPYAITINNKPVKIDQLTSRVFTDNHRRAFAWSAAWTFGLGLELWTGDDPMFTQYNDSDEPIQRYEEQHAAVAKERTASFQEDAAAGTAEPKAARKIEKTQPPAPVEKLAKVFAGDVVETDSIEKRAAQDENSPKNYKHGEYDDSPISEKRREKLLQAVRVLWDGNRTNYQELDEQFRKKFNLKRGKFSDAVQTNAHADFIINYLSGLKK